MDGKPRLIIPIESYEKIMSYAEIATGEITGFADVEYNAQRNGFVVGQVYLIEQEATGASVEMDEEAVSGFNLERIQAGATQLPRLWWHSHVNMDTFFSSIDRDTIDNFKNDSYLIALVVNKSRKMLAELKQFKPFVISDMNMPIFIDYGGIVDYSALEAEVEEKVKSQTAYTYTPPKTPGYQTPMDMDDTFDIPRGNLNPSGEDRPTIFTIEDNAEVAHRFQLPKDIKEVLKKIDRLDLFRLWSEYDNEYIFYDAQNNNVWEDTHEVFTGMTAKAANDLIAIYKTSGMSDEDAEAFNRLVEEEGSSKR